jgi:hypothetical protein
MTFLADYPVLIAADLREIIGALVGLVALVLWVIQRIIEANREMGDKQQGRAAGMPQQAQAVPPGAPRPGGQPADPLRNQVEEFLRRAGRAPQQNQGGPPRRAPQPAQEIEVLLDDSALAERPPRVPLRQQESRPAASSSEPRTVRNPIAPKKRKSLAERASERAAARSENLARQVSSLGKRVIEEDQQFDVQMKAKFDHTVGTLTAETVSPVELVPAASQTPAGQIAALLASPDGVRQAIVLNEILRRPVDRW